MVPVPVEKLAYSMREAAQATSYSRSYLYQLIKEGRLKTYRRGSRVFVTAENLKKLIDEDSNQGIV